MLKLLIGFNTISGAMYALKKILNYFFKIPIINVQIMNWFYALKKIVY